LGQAYREGKEKTGAGEIKEDKKMKKFISILGVVLFFSCVTHQPITGEEGTLSQVVNAPGVNAIDLYTKINLWFVDAFNSAESVIQYSDKAQGVIKGKYAFRSTFNGVPAWIFSTVSVEIKDERYRITISDPTMQGISTTSREVYTLDRRLLDETKNKWLLLVEDMKNSVTSPSPDW
jgi:hypothetical protein